MKKTKLIILITVLAATYQIAALLDRPGIYSNVPFSKKIEPRKINSIIIKERERTVKIEKKNNIWFITEPLEYRGDSREVENILDKLSQTKLFGPLTDKEKNYKRFEIYPDSSPFISLKADKTVSFITGGGTQDLGGTFIKFADAKEVYEAKGIYPFDFKKTYEDFIYKRIMETGEEETTGLHIKFQNIKYSDSKAQEKWVRPETKNFIDTLREINFSAIEKIEKKPDRYDLEIIIISPSGDERISFKKSRNYTAYKNGCKLAIDEPNSRKIDDLIKSLKSTRE